VSAHGIIKYETPGQVRVINECSYELRNRNRKRRNLSSERARAQVHIMVYHETLSHQ
jgi:hypothetical protein